MTSKEIITRLIDEKLINGEEAYTLINDVIIAEVVDSIKTLNSNVNTETYAWRSVPFSSPSYTTVNSSLTAASGNSI